MSQSKAELLKAVNEVLDEAIATYEKLEKSFDNTEEVQDPSKQSPDLQKEAAPIMDAAPEEKKEEKEEPKEDEKKEKKKEGEEDEKDEDEDDEKLMETYKSLCSKMEKRGLMKKSEAQPETKATEVKTEVVQKSEAVAQDNSKVEIETLKKSFSDQIDSLSKKMDAITQTVEKIAKSPAAPRKGLSGATPLRKSGDNEGKEVLSKTQALDKLIELRQKGDQRIDTALINRVETGRLTKTDYERLNSILG